VNCARAFSDANDNIWTTSHVDVGVKLSVNNLEEIWKPVAVQIGESRESGVIRQRQRRPVLIF
jgi:hypothetical protein